MKVLVGAFNQEKALVGGLLCDCTISPITRFAALIHNPHNFSAKCDHYFPWWTPGSQLSHFQATQSVLMFWCTWTLSVALDKVLNCPVMPLLVSVSSGARLPHPPQLPVPGADPLHRGRRHRGERHPQQCHRACPHRAQHHRLETPGQSVAILPVQFDIDTLNESPF